MTRREWCAKVAILVSPAFPAEAQAALLNMLPAMEHLPDTMFTERSVRKVAEVKRRQSVPAWDEIMVALDDFRRTFVPIQAPRLAAPAAPERAPPSDKEVRYVADRLAQHFREQAEDRIAREAAMPQGHASKPLRDVTAKGDALHAMRAARGLVLPDPVEQKWPDEVYGQVPA